MNNGLFTLRRFAAVCLLAAICNCDIEARVDNFRLIASNGESHELYYHSNARAVVLTAYVEGCASFDDQMPRFLRAVAEHQQHNVEFFLVESLKEQDEPQRAFQRAPSIRPPILQDKSGLIGLALQLRFGGETIILNPRTWEAVYRGGPEFDSHLVAFLTHATQGVVAEFQSTCPIDYSTLHNLRRRDAISYETEIAPLLMKKCVSCHRQGGIAPWAMTGHSIVRGFAPMIREVVRTERMPPWHADPRFGSLSNDRSLTMEEKQKLVMWVEGGTPHDGAHDPLSTAAVSSDGQMWRLGTPNMVVEIPPFQLPATGVVDYQYHFIETTLPEDVWVKATEVIPGDSAGLHHVLVSAGDGVRGSSRIMGGYAPGEGVFVVPGGSGVRVRSGATLSFQMHYTPYGKSSVDRSRLGIYFHDRPPAHELKTAVLLNTGFRIPPRVASHHATAERTFLRPVRLFALSPHAHYRGKAALFEAIFSGGRNEILLSVPNFDFNWQTIYYFNEPIDLPAGTTLKHTTWWDNSAQKAGNPDPDATVYWGVQSSSEMALGWVLFHYLDE